MKGTYLHSGFQHNIFTVVGPIAGASIISYFHYDTTAVEDVHLQDK